MNEIAKTIIQELKDRDGRESFSIVFLPYKYSMWDSMESVFEEAITANLNAYIYPVPYFTRGDNVLHHERKSFFKYKPYLLPHHYYFFKEFFGGKCPDYVVIHNPYDNHNKITEVQEPYQTKALKERGSKIIYIPYSSMMQSSNFISQMGVINSDYIVVSDDKEAKLYVDTWKRLVDVDISDRLIIAGGHPKQDIASRVPESVTVPGDWIKQGVFSRPVVSVFGGLVYTLNNPEECIECYKDIIFKEVLDGSCVLFRPHPLTRDGFEAMFPADTILWDAFLEEIKPHAIIDDTPDLYRAIHVCKRAYVDPSSVEDLLRWSGKKYKRIGVK